MVFYLPLAAFFISHDQELISVHLFSCILFQGHNIGMDHKYYYLIKVLINNSQFVNHMSASLVKKKKNQNRKAFLKLVECLPIKLMGCFAFTIHVKLKEN